MKCVLELLDCPNPEKPPYSTRSRAAPSRPALPGRIEVHTAVVDVPDPRVDRLSDMFKPKKTIYAKVTYADIAGLDGSPVKAAFPARCSTSSPRWTALSRWCAASRTKTCRTPAAASIPAAIFRQMDSEFILNDLISVERKLERLAEERKKGAGRDKGLIEREIVLFNRLQEALNEETPLRDVEISPEEEKLLSGFGFLSRKPVLVVLNLAEGQTAPELSYAHKHTQLVALQGKAGNGYCPASA